MNFSFRDLYIHVTTAIVPKTVVKIDVTEFQLKMWNIYASNELVEVRLRLAEYLSGSSSKTKKRNWAVSVQQQLTMLSDQVNTYLSHSHNKIWKSQLFAISMRSHYLYILSELDSLDQEIFILYPDYYNSLVKYPNFKMRDLMPQLRRQVDSMCKYLKACSIPDALLHIVTDGLNSLLQPRMLSRQAERYMLTFVEEVQKIENIQEKTLLEILIQHNFNKPVLLLYLMENTERMLTEIHGLHEQIEKLVQLRGALPHQLNCGRQGLHFRQRSLKDEIVAFYQQKINHLKDLIAVKRKALQDKNNMEEVFRMATELSVPQLALFIRILREKGVLVKKEQEKCSASLLAMSIQITLGSSQLEIWSKNLPR